MEELEVIAAALRAHRPGDYADFPQNRCSCGRTWARSQEEHEAEEVVQALNEAGLGVFAYANLEALAAGDITIEVET